MSGAGSLAENRCVRTSSANRSACKVFNQLESLERKLDWLIVDASGGACDLTREFALAADDALIVATPEPTAVAEAYAVGQVIGINAGSARVWGCWSIRRNRNATSATDSRSSAAGGTLVFACRFASSGLHSPRHGRYRRRSTITNSFRNSVAGAQSPATASLTRLSQRWIRPGSADGVPGFFRRLRRNENLNNGSFSTANDRVQKL